MDKSEHDPVILEPIDLSTTFHKLLPVEQQCSIYEFGKEHFPGYQSERGFGYCKASDDLYPLQNVHKRVIMMVCFKSSYNACNHTLSAMYTNDCQLLLSLSFVPP